MISKHEFKKQMERLKTAFGNENFDQERAKLIYQEVKDLTDVQFSGVVTLLISTKPRKYPPNVLDFREKAYEAKKVLFENQVTKVARDFKNNGLEKYLKDIGAESVVDAMKKVKNGE